VETHGIRIGVKLLRFIYCDQTILTMSDRKWDSDESKIKKLRVDKETKLFLGVNKELPQ
jgi:hypothetical protein